MKTESFEWAFHYSGPQEAFEDAACATCNAKRTGQCPAHGTGFAKGCAHCASAQGGACHAHWGLAAALAHYTDPSTGALAEAARSHHEATIRLLDVSSLSSKRVTVTARGALFPDGRREAEASVRPW